MTRDAWGDATKGTLIVLVVFWHVVLKSTLQVDWHLGIPVPGVWGTLADVVWPFLMPLFLLVSGVYTADALRRPWRIVLRTRVARFLYLYLLWTLVHTAAMAAFPDFPTLVPRSVGQFVEAVTISPPNTWYLLALALYVLVAKCFVGRRAWFAIAVSAALSVVVAAGWIDVVSNRGSLLFNLTFFLLGAHCAPRIRRLAARTTTPLALGTGTLYLAGYGVMRWTDSAAVPGVWPAVSVLGIAMGLTTMPLLARVPHLGARLAALGRNTLPVYLVHMPLLAVADAALTGWLSASRTGVQLVAAVVEPVVLTAALIAACLGIARAAGRDGLRWLFDLPAPRRAFRGVPWRTALAVVLIAASSTAVTRATAIAGCPTPVRQADAERTGRVTIGAVGDVLMHDVGHRIPADGGAGHFDAVRPWFTEDIVTGNLEQAVTDDTGVDKCGDRSDCLAFRSGPETAQYLDGFDLMTLANNHTGDFGALGYANTERALESEGTATVGRRDQIVCTDIGGTTVAAIGFAPYSGTNRISDLRHAERVIAAAEATADVVIVHAHMGAEEPAANRVGSGPETMFGEDRGDPRAFAHSAVDAGADLVIGHGPHSLRGMELRKGRLIAYSLGNFGGGGVFGAEQATRYGAYLSLELRDDGSLARGAVRSVDFEPVDFRPTPDASGRAAELVDAFGRRDFGAAAVRISDDGTITVPSSLPSEAAH